MESWPSKPALTNPPAISVRYLRPWQVIVFNHALALISTFTKSTPLHQISSKQSLIIDWHPSAQTLAMINSPNPSSSLRLANNKQEAPWVVNRYQGSWDAGDSIRLLRVVTTLPQLKPHEEVQWDRLQLKFQKLYMQTLCPFPWVGTRYWAWMSTERHLHCSSEELHRFTAAWTTSRMLLEMPEVMYDDVHRNIREKAWSLAYGKTWAIREISKPSL